MAGFQPPEPTPDKGTQPVPSQTPLEGPPTSSKTHDSPQHVTGNGDSGFVSVGPNEAANLRQMADDLRDTVSIRDSVVRDARAKIHLYPEELLTNLHNRADEVVHIPDSSLGAIPGSLRADYAIAVNRIATQARENLASNRPATDLLDDLIEQRDDRLRAYRGKTSRSEGERNLHLSNYGEYGEALQMADQKLCEVIERIAHGDQNSLELEIRGLDLAIMVLRREAQNRQVAASMQEHRSEVLTHAELMREAFAAVRGENWRDLYQQAASPVEAAFLLFCDLKLRQNGYIPPAHFIHDVDGNLVPDEDSKLKPGNVLGRMAEQLDAEHSIPSYQRLVLLDNIARVHRFGKIGEEMFRYAGEHTHELFADAKACVDSGIKEGIATSIITANMTEYGRGIAAHFAAPEQVHVTGKEVDSSAAEDKHYRLVERFLQYPDGVFVMSDNSDSSLARAVKAGHCFPGEGSDAALTELFFFASRVAGDGDPNDHQLARALREVQVPFAENKKIDRPGESPLGYQGTSRLTELYLQWRQDRVAEGWPETRLGADAQEEVYRLVAGGRDAHREVRSSLEQRRAELLEQVAETGGNHDVFKGLADVALKLQLLEGHGVSPTLQRAQDLYDEAIQQLGNDDSLDRNVIAARSFRAAVRELSLRNGNGANGLHLEGEIRRSEIGKEGVAVINAGELEIEKAASLRERRDFQRAMEMEGVSYVLARVVTGRDNYGAPIEQTIALATPAADKSALKKLKDLKGTPVLGGEGYLLPTTEATATHEQQLSAFQRHLHGYLKVAEVYYRNGFAPAGGVEKTIREQAKVLAESGYRVRVIGGNAPDGESYDRELLDRFEHRVVTGAHERDARALRVAEALYRGEVHEEYHDLYAEIKDQMREALKDVDYAILHNPLFLRNVPFTQAIVDLYREGELGDTKIVGWVHDIAAFTEPERFPEAGEVKPGSPWWYANTRIKGIHYIGVSQAVADKIATVPCEDPADPISSTNHPPVSPGSDYFAMLGKSRAVDTMQSVINWKETDTLWVTPGRIADRKNQLAAIEAVALQDRSKLLIMGAPKVVREQGIEQIKDPYYELLRETVRQMGVEQKVIFLWDHIGAISDREYETTLAGLVGFADGVLTLPKEEGFGIDARNGALFNPVVVVSDDEALQKNLGDSARFVARGAHALHAAVEMQAAVLDSPNTNLRRASRTSATWKGQLEQVFPLLGTKELGSELAGKK